jgi:hypothetical protein
MNCKCGSNIKSRRNANKGSGYHVTMLKDTTAGFTKEQKDAATELVWPLFAHEVKTVGEWIKTL